MKRSRMFCLTATVWTALCASPTAGSAKPLLLTDPAGTVPAGTALTAESSDLVFSAGLGGAVECERSVLSAALTSNGLSKDGAVADAWEAFGEYEGVPGACRGSESGPVDVTWGGLGGAVTLKNSGTFTVTGDKRLEVTMTFLAAESVKCRFEAKRKDLDGTFEVGGPGAPAALDLGFAGQPFLLFPKNPESVCPREVQLGGTLSVSDPDGAVSASA